MLVEPQSEWTGHLHKQMGTKPPLGKIQPDSAANRFGRPNTSESQRTSVFLFPARNSGMTTASGATWGSKCPRRDAQENLTKRQI